MTTKVVHVISGLLMGGAEMMLYKLLRRTNPERFQHEVVSLSEGNGPMVERIEALGVPVHQCRMRSGLPNPFAALNVARLIRRLHPDLLHGWMYHGNLAAQASSAVLPSSVPVIWTICDSHLRHAKKSTGFVVALGARLSSLPAHIVSDSKASAVVHREYRGFCERPWEFIPNGFDAEKFQPSENARRELRAELSLPADTLLIGAIGRYNAQKGHSYFLDAAAMLRRQVPDAHFLVAGRDVAGNPMLLRQIDALDLSGAVHLLQERTDMPRVAAALDIFVSSSISESLPGVVGEAMCCGVPCVVTDVGDSAWLVDDTGIVVPPAEPRALAEACAGLIASGKEGRKTLGVAARERIMNHLSLEAFVERYERVYQRTLDGKRPGNEQAAAQSPRASGVWGGGA